MTNVGAKSVEFIGAAKEGLLIDRHFERGGKDVWIGLEKIK